MNETKKKKPIAKSVKILYLVKQRDDEMESDQQQVLCLPPQNRPRSHRWTSLPRRVSTPLHEHLPAPRDLPIRPPLHGGCKRWWPRRREISKEKEVGEEEKDSPRILFQMRLHWQHDRWGSPIDLFKRKSRWWERSKCYETRTSFLFRLLWRCRTNVKWRDVVTMCQLECTPIDATNATMI